MPYDTTTHQINTGWRLFANGIDEFSTGERVGDIGIDLAPVAGSENLVQSGGVYGALHEETLVKSLSYAQTSWNNLNRRQSVSLSVGQTYKITVLVTGGNTPPSSIDYSTRYLTFEALEAGTFTLTIPAGITTSHVPSVSYSTDDGNTWTTVANSDKAS